MDTLVTEYKQWRKAEGLPFNPNFVPKAYDGLADLDLAYGRREQAAIDLERELAAKKALPPARPRKKAAPRTTTAMFEELGKLTAKEIKDATAPLEARIAQLENKPSPLQYRDVWRADGDYKQGNFVTWAGSVWHVNVDGTKAKPGTSADHTLAVKRGADGRPGKDAAK